MKAFPESLEKYKQTPIFTEETVPAGLLSEHNTKAGVWGKIIVLEGELDYTIPSQNNQTFQLSPNRFGVVEPLVLHSVKPKGKVRFYVEFYK